MNKPFLLTTAAVLLGLAAGGAALATPHLLEGRDARVVGLGDERPTLTAGERLRVADDDHRRRDEARGTSGRHHADEEDDDEDDGSVGGLGARPGMTGPTDPATPVPDNGLFQGKARPKVEVN